VCFRTDRAKERERKRERERWKKAHCFVREALAEGPSLSSRASTTESTGYPHAQSRTQVSPLGDISKCTRETERERDGECERERVCVGEEDSFKERERERKRRNAEERNKGNKGNREEKREERILHTERER
jgi:hypothetical protein